MRVMPPSTEELREAAMRLLGSLAVRSDGLGKLSGVLGDYIGRLEAERDAARLPKPDDARVGHRP